MIIQGIITKIAVLLVSMMLLILMKFDLGFEFALALISIVALFIFYEVVSIKKTLTKIYSDALTENRFLLFFLGNGIVNIIVSSVFSVYISFYLFIHVNIIETQELGLYLISGILLTTLLANIKTTTNYFFKELPAGAFFRLSLIFIVVLITVICDGVYNSFLPIDDRIAEVFDKDIPLYVIDDVKHSYIYFQHLLRTALYFKLNLQSIVMSDELGEWFSIVRFLLLLSPTPYVAYALLYLSFTSLIDLNVFKRNNNA